jgi:hypothetical protein
VRPPAVPADVRNLDEKLATVDVFFETMNVHVSGPDENERRVILANRRRRSSERGVETALTWCEWPGRWDRHSKKRFDCRVLHM